MALAVPKSISIYNRAELRTYSSSFSLYNDWVRRGRPASAIILLVAQWRGGELETAVPMHADADKKKIKDWRGVL
jgi:hypothetical protein